MPRFSCPYTGKEYPGREQANNSMRSRILLGNAPLFRVRWMRFIFKCLPRFGLKLRFCVSNAKEESGAQSGRFPAAKFPIVKRNCRSKELMKKERKKKIDFLVVVVVVVVAVVVVGMVDVGVKSGTSSLSIFYGRWCQSQWPCVTASSQNRQSCKSLAE